MLNTHLAKKHYQVMVLHQMEWQFKSIFLDRNTGIQPSGLIALCIGPYYRLSLIIQVK